MSRYDGASMPRAVDKLPETRHGRLLIQALVGYFDARLVGHQNVPGGGVLLVINHGIFGLDSFVLGALLARDLRRLPTWLADRNLWKAPGFGRVLDYVGAVPGTPDAAVGSLRSGELVVVYPGGIFDSYKLWRERNKLQWRGRAGFARVAMRAGVPIVPVAATGVDDMYRVVAHEPGIGRVIFGDARYNFPIALGRWGTPVPRPVPVTMHALPPVSTRGDWQSEADVERVRSQVHDAIQAKLDEG